MDSKFISIIDQTDRTSTLQIRNGKIQVLGILPHGTVFNFKSKTDAMMMLLFCQSFINRVDAVNTPESDFMAAHDEAMNYYKNKPESEGCDAIKDHPSRLLDRMTGGPGKLTE